MHLSYYIMVCNLDCRYISYAVGAGKALFHISKFWLTGDIVPTVTTSFSISYWLGLQLTTFTNFFITDTSRSAANNLYQPLPRRRFALITSEVRPPQRMDLSSGTATAFTEILPSYSSHIATDKIPKQPFIFFSHFYKCHFPLNLNSPRVFIVVDRL